MSIGNCSQTRHSTKVESQRWEFQEVHCVHLEELR